MLKFISYFLFVFLIGGLLSLIPDNQNINSYNQPIKIGEQNYKVYNEWTIKQIDSLSACSNQDLAAN